MQSVLDTILYYLTKNAVLVNHPAVPLLRKFDDTITAWSDIGGSRRGVTWVATPTFQN